MPNFSDPAIQEDFLKFLAQLGPNRNVDGGIGATSLGNEGEDVTEGNPPSLTGDNPAAKNGGLPAQLFDGSGGGGGRSVPPGSPQLRPGGLVGTEPVGGKVSLSDLLGSGQGPNYPKVGLPGNEPHINLGDENTTTIGTKPLRPVPGFRPTSKLRGF